MFTICFNLDSATVKVYRWTDQVLGPRKMPDLKSPLTGLTEVTSDSVFSISVEEKIVKIGDVALESELVFRISE